MLAYLCDQNGARSPEARKLWGRSWLQSNSQMAATHSFEVGLHKESVDDKLGVSLCGGKGMTVVVREVIPGGVASSNGIRAGDTLAAIDGRIQCDALETARLLRSTVGNLCLHVERDITPTDDEDSYSDDDEEAMLEDERAMWDEWYEFIQDVVDYIREREEQELARQQRTSEALATSLEAQTPPEPPAEEAMADATIMAEYMHAMTLFSQASDVHATTNPPPPWPTCSPFSSHIQPHAHQHLAAAARAAATSRGRGGGEPAGHCCTCPLTSAVRLPSSFQAASTEHLASPSPHVMILPSSAPSPDRADARTTHPDPGATSWRLTSRTSTSLTTRALTASSRSGESSRTRPTMKRRTWARRTTWWWSPTARRTASRESTTVRMRRCSAHSRGQPLQVLDAMASSIGFAAASR